MSTSEREKVHPGPPSPDRKFPWYNKNAGTVYYSDNEKIRGSKDTIEEYMPISHEEAQNITMETETRKAGNMQDGGTISSTPKPSPIFVQLVAINRTQLAQNALARQLSERLRRLRTFVDGTPPYKEREGEQKDGRTRATPHSLVVSSVQELQEQHAGILSDINREIDELFNSLGHDPAFEELADSLDETPLREPHQY